MQIEEWVYDPNDPETYPSICQEPEVIYDRFSLRGGEVLRQTNRELRAYRDGVMLWRWINQEGK